MPRLLNLRPSGGARLVLGLLPLLAVVLLYLAAAAVEGADPPEHRLLPTPAVMAVAMIGMARIDPSTGQAPLVRDTMASVGRIASALTIAAMVALALGIVIGLLPLARAVSGPAMALATVIPPIALLPMVFAAWGTGGGAASALIVCGVTPFMVRDLARHIAAIPEAQIVKAQTLGASTWQTMVRVALPQALPALIDLLRGSLGAAWVLLIAAEAIAAHSGLGYRIFAMRNGPALDVILPYVAWISILSFLADWSLLLIRRRAFGWATPAKAA